MTTEILLNQEDLGLLELALEGYIAILENRFEAEGGFIHPAKKFKELYDKLSVWREPLPVSAYTLSAIKINGQES